MASRIFGRKINIKNCLFWAHFLFKQKSLFSQRGKGKSGGEGNDVMEGLGVNLVVRHYWWSWWMGSCGKYWSSTSVTSSTGTVSSQDSGISITLCTVVWIQHFKGENFTCESWTSLICDNSEMAEGNHILPFVFLVHLFNKISFQGTISFWGVRD